MQISQRFGGAAFLLLALGSVGCSNLRTVDVDSKPPGAVIYVNGEKRGATRATVSIDFDVAPRALIQVVKPRYKPMLEYVAWADLNPDGKPSLKVFILEAE